MLTPHRMLDDYHFAISDAIFIANLFLWSTLYIEVSSFLYLISSLS